MKRHFTEDDIQMANEHTKKFKLISYWEPHVNTTVRYFHTPIGGP